MMVKVSSGPGAFRRRSSSARFSGLAIQSRPAWRSSDSDGCAGRPPWARWPARPPAPRYGTSLGVRTVQSSVAVDMDEVQVGAGQQLGQQLFQLGGVLHDGRPGAAVPDDIGALFGRVGGVDGDRGGPRQQDAYIRQHPFQAGLRDDVDPVLRPDADRRQPRGYLLGLGVGLAPGEVAPRPFGLVPVGQPVAAVRDAVGPGLVGAPERRGRWC